MKTSAICFLILGQFLSVNAFAPNAQTRPSTSLKLQSENNSRRNFIKDVSIFSLVGLSTQITNIAPANASGGATAGGAYLLSAKQRYNERVKSGILGFAALGESLSSGSLDETKTYFASEEVGGWKDASAAGYLLANAFRRSSTTPPDSLPSVKKWKAFAAAVMEMEKPLKKKDAKNVKVAYDKALGLLDAYLEGVELPPLAELK